MNYKDLKEIAESKNIKIKDIAEQTGYTRQGLQSALDNETIELRKLKTLCDVLRIKPAQFFDSKNFGIIQDNSAETEFTSKLKRLEQEIKILKERLEDKNKIIDMLERNTSKQNIAATPIEKYNSKKES